MAKRKRNLTPMIVGAVIIGVAAAGVGYLLWRDSRDAALEAARPGTPLALPAGELRLLRRGVTDARLLAVGETKPGECGVQTTVLILGKFAATLANDASIIVQNKTVDCAAGRVLDGTVGYFDVDGALLKGETLAAGRMGRPPASDEVEVQALCGSPATGRLYGDVRKAQRDLQTPPGEYAQRLVSHPDDPAVLAWLCTVGARDRWRQETPQDCDKAVRLNPDDTSLLIERAYLNLRTGRQAQADRDFQAALTKEPQNARALLGRALLFSVQGKDGDSRRLGLQALKIDPQIAVWASETYQVIISTSMWTS